MSDAAGTWILWIVGGFQMFRNAILLIRNPRRPISWTNLGLGLVVVLSAKSAVAGNVWSVAAVAIVVVRDVIVTGREYPIVRSPAVLLGLITIGMLLLGGLFLGR